MDLKLIKNLINNAKVVNRDVASSAATRKRTMLGQKYFKGWRKTSVWGTKIYQTQLNK